MRVVLSLSAICLFFSFGFCEEKPISPREEILTFVAGEWIAKSMYTVAELDIAGYLLEGPKSVQELAKLSGSHEESLYRILRMLASRDLFSEGENRVFSNTETSALLAKAHPQSLRSLVIFYSEEMSESWNHLPSCIKEGKPAFDLKFGESVFTFYREHPDSALLFHLAMKEKARALIASCLEVFDFNRFNLVYDIGGGVGLFLSTLLQAYPNMYGVLYELPEVIPAARSLLGSEKRCSVISGDFFETIPPGGDCYLLKSILHDWSEKEALKVLKRCHDAMSKKAKLIIVEPTILEGKGKDYAKMMDVHMMVVTGGRERTVAEFHELLRKAGFVIDSITPTATEFCVIEASKIE